MDLRRQLSILRTWLWLLIASVLFAAFLVSGAMPRVYDAEDTLIVGQSLTSSDPNSDQLLAAQRLTQTYVAVATTRPLAQLVIDKLKLQMTPDNLLKEVQATTPTNSALIVIRVSDTDPVRAASIADQFAFQLQAKSPSIQGQGDLQTVKDNLQSTQDQMAATQSQIDALPGGPPTPPCFSTRVTATRTR